MWLWHLRWNRDVVVPVKVEHSTVTCSPHFNQPQISELTTVCYKEKLLWSWLMVALVHGHAYNYLGGRLATYPLSKTQ